MLEINHHAANAVSVACGETTVFFSYQTIVAIHHHSLRVKTEKHYSKTTSSHMSKMGVNNYTPLPESVFHQLVEDVIITFPNLTSILTLA